MTTRLTRQSFLNAMNCPRLGWFSRLVTPPMELTLEQGTLADRFRVDEQKAVHDRARALFPEATIVTRQAYEAACWQTQDLLERPGTRAILDAAFGTNNCRARADALVRMGDEWHLYEVKADTVFDAAMVNEVAYVWMVLEAAGVGLGGASLLLVSRDYRAGMADDQMVSRIDVTAQAAPRAAEFRDIVALTDERTRGAEPPVAQLIPHCRRCPMFRSCAGSDIEHPIFELPHLGPLQLEELLGQGYRSVTNVPETTPLTKRQLVVRQAVRSGKAVLTGDLRAALETVVWPACYLDFETVETAVPLFSDFAPFERLPFLYSVRVCHGPGALQSHRSYLAPHERDGSRELAERLIQDLSLIHI